MRVLLTSLSSAVRTRRIRFSVLCSYAEHSLSRNRGACGCRGKRPGESLVYSGGGFEPTLTIGKISSRCASSRRPCLVPALRLVGRERVVARVEATHHPGSNRTVLREVRP